MAKGLQGLIKPPFIFGGNYKWDWDTHHIRVDMAGSETAVLKVMPLADISYYRELLGRDGYFDFIKEFTAFTVAALHEKWERDFG